MSKTGEGSIEQGKPITILEAWMLDPDNDRLRGKVYNHPRLVDGARVGLDTDRAIIPSYLETPYNDDSEDPAILHTDVEVKSRGVLYRLKHEDEDLEQAMIVFRAGYDRLIYRLLYESVQ